MQVGAGQDPVLTKTSQLWPLAAYSGYVEMVRFLVEIGADKEQTDNCGQRPLHIAAKAGDLNIVRFLIERGASHNSTTEAGKTALDLASERGHTDVVGFLSELDSQSPRKKVQRVGSDRPEA